MATNPHRRSRRFHTLRYGLAHYRQHRHGIKHSHRRERSVTLAQKAAERRRKRRPWIIGGSVLFVLVVAFVFLGSAYRSLLSARDDIAAAQAGASAISHHPNLLTSANGRAQLAATLATMNDAASSASKTLDSSTSLSILSVLPFVGAEVDGARSLVDDARTLTDQGTVLLSRLRTLTNDSQATKINLTDLEALSSQITASSTKLAGLERSAGGLWGPIRGARIKFNKDLSYVNGVLGKGGQALRYAAPLLGADGPRHYFIAAENNSEMRDQGAVLSWALLSTNNGEYAVDSPQSVSTIGLDTPAPFALPPGTAEVFGPLQPTQIWQSTNATADFPLSGAIMSSMYTKATHGQSVDGVIGVDVMTLKALLALTGPVHVEGIGTDVTAQNLTGLVLNRLYLRFPAGDEQAARRDELAQITKAIVDQLKQSPVDVARLVRALATCVQQRHLMIYDANPTNEATVTSFNASGSVASTDPTRTFHLAVESAVAAKMDYYIHTSVTYSVRVLSSGEALVQTTLLVRNTAPRGAHPSYALGPDHTNSFVPGQYVSRTYLWSPKGSSVPGGINESGLVVDPTNFSVNAGDSTTVRFQTSLPHAVRNGRLILHFIPQGLLWPQRTTVTVSGDGVSFGGPTVDSWVATKSHTFSVKVQS